MPQSPDDLLSVRQAALLVGVSPETIRRYSNSGRLPALRTPTNQRRFRRSDVDALLTPQDPGPSDEAAAAS